LRNHGVGKDISPKIRIVIVPQHAAVGGEQAQDPRRNRFAYIAERIQAIAVGNELTDADIPRAYPPMQSAATTTSQSRW